MNFLAPLFLVGALAVALPLVFHLIRRTSRVRTRFSSLMFLRPVPPRMTRRNRLEDLALLCLRCLVIALLALGFSRPLWNASDANPVSPAPARQVIALLDVSASMRRGGLWEQAQARLQGWVDGMAAGDELAVWTFGRRTQCVMDFAEWSGLAQGERAGWVNSRMAGVSPGWSSTHLDRALIEAGEALALPRADSWSGRRQVVVFSDLQAGSRLDDLQGYDWPDDVEIVLETLTAQDHNNAGIQQLPAGGGGVRRHRNTSGPAGARRERSRRGRGAVPNQMDARGGSDGDRIRVSGLCSGRAEPRDFGAVPAGELRGERPPLGGGRGKFR